MKRNVEVRSCNYCCSWKVMSMTYSECGSLALGIQHAMRMCHIVICGLPCSTIFFTLSHKQYDLKKKLLNIKCGFWVSLQLLSETFLILRRSERDMIKNVYWSSCKVQVILVWSETNWIFSTEFRKVHKYQMSWKFFVLEPSCSMRTDRRTDVTKLIVAFRHCAKAPKNGSLLDLGWERRGLVWSSSG